MARSGIPTRERIISAASALFYNDGIRGVSVDAVAAKAGVTKRTLYYHFRSKDDLVAAYLAARDQPNLALFKQWFAETDDGLPAQVERIFRNLARSARHPEVERLRVPAHIGRTRQHARPSRDEDRRRPQEEVRGVAARNLCGGGDRAGVATRPADIAAARRLIRRRAAAPRSLLHGDGRSGGACAD